MLLANSRTNDFSDSSSTITSDGSKAIKPLMKRRMSVLNRLLGAEEKEYKDLSVLEEVKSYFLECPIKQREDFLWWWRVNGSHFLHLETLARKYLAIPATSTPSRECFQLLG